MSDWIARAKRGQAHLQAADGYEWRKDGLWVNLFKSEEPVAVAAVEAESGDE